MRHDADTPTSRPWSRVRRRLWAVPAVAAAGAALVLGPAWLDDGPERSAPSAAQAPTERAEPTSPAPVTPVPTTPVPTTPGPTSAAPPDAAVPAPAAAPTTPAAERGGNLPEAAAPVWLTVPAARIDQPIVALTPTAGDLAGRSIVPPMTMDAYWLTTYGRPGEGSQNTTYITGHSWEGLDAPFDRLSTDVAPGDSVVVGTGTGELRYVVESVTTHDKNTLKNSDIWNVVPNRLVLISCFTADPWGRNVIVTAVPAA